MNMRKIYRKIAEKHHVSVAEVKREMETAVAQAWMNPDNTADNMAMQKRISADGFIPKVEDVIRFLAKETVAEKS